MATTPTSASLLQEVKAQPLSIATAAILRSTIQFFYTRKGRIAACGSGVLLTVDNRYFVATAAHVLAGQAYTTFVILPPHEVTLAGTLLTTSPPPPGRRQDDKIDLAVLELTDAGQIGQLREAYQFLTLAELSTSPRHLTDVYLSVGFPAATTRSFNGHVKTAPYPLQVQRTKDFDYAGFRLHPAAHLVLDFTGDVLSVTNPAPHRRPKMEGISGSGLWDTGNYLLGDPAQERKLVGIVTEELTVRRRKYLLVTRTTVLLEFMRQSFGLNIPVSTTVKVNLSRGLQRLADGQARQAAAARTTSAG
ncbi:trypsin-like peptidase domain-containing protein [Hymenobacter busanensis]|uniref:Trypsin-like peptidase domain-containing protein n=1 Tax=Hymenobacter busanensis TaxID=2607656 RepID=A0AA88FEQ1_9BACT|nr:trypsin-like peptidase domain-containing protein [Hymenobacter busanensis]KAA9325108.1 trypsin-like peptidase domain-containing protein [Hymenobacter busanensis]